jgi:hypothetical protein
VREEERMGVGPAEKLIKQKGGKNIPEHVRSQSIRCLCGTRLWENELINQETNGTIAYHARHLKGIFDIIHLEEGKVSIKEMMGRLTLQRTDPLLSKEMEELYRWNNNHSL